MATYSRSIGRITSITSVAPTPTWVSAMTNTNTVYSVGDNARDVLPGKIVWPSAGRENTLYTGTDANYVYMHVGYGGSLYMPDVGAHGTMVFGYTGEATFCEQMTSFTMADAKWDFFQQPQYATSLSEAISMDADWYYSPADYAALPAARKIPAGPGEPTWRSGWDKGFPVGFVDWVMRRKSQSTYLGNNRPHWFRYGMPAYVPASATGTGSGAIVVNSRGTIYGPFSQGPKPSGMPEADWFADVWPSGNRKHYLYAMNVSTRQWSKIPTPIPDRNRGANGEAYHPQSVWDPVNKRIYYSIYDVDNAIYWADLSGGLANLSWGGPVTLSSPTNANWAMLGDDGNSALCVPTSGANAGRRLWYFKHNRGDGLPWLGMVDLDKSTIHRMQISGLPSVGDVWGITYDATNNMVLITTKGTFGVRLYKFQIPSDPTNAAGYSVFMTQLAFASGVTLESGEERTKQLGQRNMYLPTLGVILMTQRYGRMLAYRPA